MFSVAAITPPRRRYLLDESSTPEPGLGSPIVEIMLCFGLPLTAAPLTSAEPEWPVSPGIPPPPELELVLDEVDDAELDVASPPPIPLELDAALEEEAALPELDELDAAPTWPVPSPQATPAKAVASRAARTPRAP